MGFFRGKRIVQIRSLRLFHSVPQTSLLAKFKRILTLGSLGFLLSACDLPLYRSGIPLPNSVPDPFGGIPPYAPDYRPATLPEVASLFEQICAKGDREILNDKDAFTDRGDGHFKGRHIQVSVRIKSLKNCEVGWRGDAHSKEEVMRAKPAGARIFGPNVTIPKYGIGWAYILDTQRLT